MDTNVDPVAEAAFPFRLPRRLRPLLSGVQSRLVLAFACVVLLQAVLAAFAYYGLRHSQHRHKERVDEPLAAVLDLARLRANLNLERLEVGRLLEAGGSGLDEVEAVLQQRRAEDAVFLSRLSVRLSRLPRAEAEWRAVLADWRQFDGGGQNQILALVRQGRLAEARTLHRGVLSTQHERLRGRIQRIEASELAHADDVLAREQQRRDLFLVLFLTVGAVSILGALCVGLLMHRAFAAYVADRRRAQTELQQVNRALRAIGACNQATVHARSEAELLELVCRVVVDHAGYRMAWVGYADDGPEKRVRPVASAGHVDGYLDQAHVSWADTERGRGPTGTGVRTGRITVCRDMATDPRFIPWREEALKRGYGSSIVLPLIVEGKILGALSIYASEAGAFDSAEAEWLKDLGEDIAYGIQGLRTREEHERAEKALAKLSAYNRRLIESTPDPMGTIGTDGRIKDVNAATEAATGRSRAELLGTRFSDYFTDPAQAEAGYQQVFRDGSVRDYPLELRHRQGHVMPVLYNATVFHDEGGAVAGVLACARDVTERRRAEDQLRESRQRLQALLDHSPALVSMQDDSGRYVLANRHFESRFARAGRSLVGHTHAELLPPDEAARADARFRQVLLSGLPVSYEETDDEHAGRRVYLTTKFPIRDEAGHVFGVGAISTDITERKNLETQYLHAQKMEAFGQLAGGVAHDFNNILAVMTMQFSLLTLKHGLPAEVEKALGELDTLAKRAAALTRQLLIFSRRQELSTKPLDLNTTVENVGMMLKRLIGENINLSITPADAPLPIEGDEGMIEQVVTNLCVNARDAMPEGGRIWIRLTSELRGSERAGQAPSLRRFACLAVMDTGCGMDEATRKRIFEPFFTTKPAGRGTGLGLATVYGIVRQHQGWIEVDTAPNRGSTFRVYLPMSDEAARIAAPGPAHVARGGTESLLLVEDEDLVRSTFALCLRHAGYRVTEAPNGVQAVRLWEQQQGDFALLLTDLVMPGGMSGIQLARCLVALKPDLRVVLTTGYSDDSALEDPTLRQACVLLGKPCSPEQLLDAVRTALDAPVAAGPC